MRGRDAQISEKNKLVCDFPLTFIPQTTQALGTPACQNHGVFWFGVLLSVLAKSAIHLVLPVLG